eukprot:gene11900-13866_t
MTTQLSLILKSFNKLRVDTLKDTLSAFGRDIPTNPKKPELISLMKSLICTQTYSFILEDVGFKDLFAKEFSVDTKDVLTNFESLGLTPGLERLSDESLNLIFERLLLNQGEEDGTTPTRADKIARIEEEFLLQGVNKLLYKLTQPVLKLYCTDLKQPFTEGDINANADLLMKVMFDLEGDEEEEPSTPSPPPVAAPPAKKPAAKDAKPAKPAAAPKKKAAAKPVAKTPVSPKKGASKPAAADAKRANGKAVAKPAAAADGKRERKPVQKYDSAVEAAKAKPSTPTKRKKVESEDEEESEEEYSSDDQSSKKGRRSTTTAAAAAPKKTTTTKKAATAKATKKPKVDVDRPTQDSPNPFGGYYSDDGKYVSPSIDQITKGVTFDDLHNYFNLQPLQDFAKLHNIANVSQKKTLIIKNIVSFLNGEKVPVPKSIRKKAKFAKMSASKAVKAEKEKAKKAAAAAAPTTTSSSTTTTTTATPAAAVTPAVEAPTTSAGDSSSTTSTSVTTTTVTTESS